VRRHFEARFTSARMAEDYVAAYERLLSAPGFGRPFADERVAA
jgi:hypothetical protein